MIYYVEDDSGIRELVVYTLNQTGLEARGFAESQAFYAACAERKPDLILLDIMLPGIDGLTVCRNLKNTPALADVPIIMLTAKGEENDIVLGLEMGADDYITKPYSSKILAARIAVQLRRKQSVAPVSQTITLGPLSMDLTAHSVRLNGKIVLQEERFDVLRSKAEYELEGKRSPFSFDEGKAKFPDIFPAGIFFQRSGRRFRFVSVRCIKKIFLEISIQFERVKSYDLAFNKRKAVESLCHQKLGHKFFNIRQCQ